MDDSYFGPQPVRGKRGPAAGSKTIVFGVFKRNGRSDTKIVPKARKSTLQAIIRGKVDLDSALHADGRRGYPGLLDVGYAKRFRVEHGRNEFVNEPAHSNGIASFWVYAKW